MYRSCGNTNVMRHIFTILLLISFMAIYSCDEERDYDPNTKPKETFTNTIYKSYSPDKTKLLTLKEHGRKGEIGYTQIFIEFEGTGSGVYSVDTIKADIKTYWVTNNQIVIETKKNYKGIQKWNQVQSFGDIVKVQYIER